MGRQKLRVDQLIVPAGTPNGHVPTVASGELTYSPPAGGAADLFFVDIRDHGADTAAADNTTEIQAAADAAAGGVLVIPKGTWVTDPISIAGDTAVHLYGTLRLRAQDASTLPASFGVLYAYGTSSVRLSNVHILGFGGKVDGNRDGLTGTPPTLDSECINFKYVDNGSVIGVEVFDSYDSGIDLDHSSNCIIRGNYAHGCGGWGFHLSNGAVDNLIEGNTATGCGATHSRGGFDQYDGSTPEANRNRFIGNRAVSNYRNFNINGALAIFDASNSSESGTVADVFTADLTTLRAVSLASSLTVQDENSNVSTAVTRIDFQGDVVTATAGTGEVVVTIAGGGSGGELLMQDGVTGPPVPLETEGRDDWIYEG